MKKTIGQILKETTRTMGVTQQTLADKAGKLEKMIKDEAEKLNGEDRDIFIYSVIDYLESLSTGAR